MNEPEATDINPPAEPTIEISIDSRGNILLETLGCEGKQCDLLAGALERSLGQVTGRVDKKCYDGEIQD